MLVFKKTAVNDLKTEYTMKLIINTFVLLTMTISGLFLMYIKSLSEMSDKKVRADFLKCMGMRKKERVSLLKRELYYFYWLPELITIVVTSILQQPTFHARMYTHAVRIAWLKQCCLDMAYVSGSTVGICMDIRKIYHSKGGRKR